jgi:hypothetical protein
MQLDPNLENFVVMSTPEEPEFRLVMLSDNVVSLVGAVDHQQCPPLSYSPPSRPVFSTFTPAATSTVDKLSLCQTATAALLYFLGIVEDPIRAAHEVRHFDVPVDRFDLATAFSCVGDILREERAGSLTQVKSLLEFVLWGPDFSEVDPSGNDPQAVEKVRS